jgi:putative hemolysin
LIIFVHWFFPLLFRFNRAHKSQDFMRTPSARRSRRSLRSGYAFAHQEGFGKLITSGKIMRKTGLNFGSKASSNNAANNNSGSLHNVSSGGGLASTSDQPDGKSSQKITCRLPSFRRCQNWVPIDKSDPIRQTNLRFYFDYLVRQIETNRFKLAAPGKNCQLGGGGEGGVVTRRLQWLLSNGFADLV